MAKPKKPACPPHDYRLTEERDGWITHTCRKCGDAIKRQQGRSEHVGRFYALGLAALVVLGMVLTIWAGGAA